MKILSKEYDLIIVGDGDFKNECEQISQQLNLQNRVHFLGSCLSDESPYYYNNCDVFILPTRFNLNDNVQVESWGFTINEAMALEIPVVSTTAVGGAFDLIIDGKTGGLAAAGSVENLVDKINFVIENNKNNKIGRQAKEHLMKVCNYDDNLVAYKSIINKVLD